MRRRYAGIGGLFRGVARSSVLLSLSETYIEHVNGSSPNDRGTFAD
jgi:hypothetical protein